MLIVFVHFVLVKLAMKYIIFFILYVFWGGKEKFIGNFPVYPNCPDIRQLQKSLNPKNSNDLKKITQSIDIIMKIFEHYEHYENISIDNWIVWLLYLYIVKRSCLCIDI